MNTGTVRRSWLICLLLSVGPLTLLAQEDVPQDEGTTAAAAQEVQEQPDDAPPPGEEKADEEGMSSPQSGQEPPSGGEATPDGVAPTPDASDDDAAVEGATNEGNPAGEERAAEATDLPAGQPVATEPATTPPPETVDTDPLASSSDIGRPAAEAFEAVFAEWKVKLKEIRDTISQYKIAEESQLPELREQFDAKVTAAHAMEPRLRDAAVAAYREAPNEDRELVRFLITVAADEIRRDDYLSARELTSVLIEGGSDEKELSDLAGLAAYGTNDFDAAEKYFQQAEAEGSISNQESRFLGSVEECKTTWKKEVELRAAEAEADDLPRVRLQTDVGDIVLELFENEAPETVGNFISLVEKGFYDQLTFHRVLEAFMAQAGCPEGTGSGGPGYNIYCECANDNHRNHFAGSLSMAKQAARNTGGSQFFLTFVPTPHLNGLHTVFGRVVEGWDVLPKIEKRDPDASTPLHEPTKIIKAEVLRKRDHEYRPNKVK